MYSYRQVALVGAALALGATLTACAPGDEAYAGNELFAANCSSCHGIYGDGNGPAAATIAQSVPDLRQIANANDGAFPRDVIRKVVDGREIIEAHSSDSMPKWGQEFLLSEGYSQAAERRVTKKIDALVAYVESIQTTD